MKADGLVVLGTLRVDGWPRISPCEAYVVDGELLLGMMWQSKKALDLLRDPRIAVATVQDDREAKHGDLKLYGTVRDVPEPERRQAYSDALFAAIAWRPSEPYHLFALEIERAGFITFDNDRRLIRWSVESGMEVLRHPDPSPP
ncbi:MAG TPA: pyridoxamine 5'-phosphate oxidase family protein [Candidatus Limnocylindrales bacterium]|nr:pyridoxamine 5'-phosphate oxidase family protein [Candidatus Limnocylindrales bacterium]